MATMCPDPVLIRTILYFVEYVASTVLVFRYD